MDEIVSTIASTIRFSTPLIFVALGVLVSERSGVINLAVEGIMLIGCFVAASIAYVTGNPWLGLAAAAFAGVCIASAHAAATVALRADQVVSGMALNLFALGATAFVGSAVFGTTGSTPHLEGTASFGSATYLGLPGPLCLSILAFGLVAALTWILYQTPWGLRLRAVGERPLAAEPAGVSVRGYRVVAVLISGALAAAGGAYLSTATNTAFSRNMTAGRGFIAIAAVILGRWHPVGAMLGCLLFGFSEAVEIRIPQGWVPDQLLQVLPHLVTIAVLVIWARKSAPPAALGKIYERGRAD
jgi:general nucleoside transport system permease protein